MLVSSEGVCELTKGVRYALEIASNSPINGHLFLAVAVAVGWVGSGGAVCIPLRGGISR